ncbi:MAG: hypothetical protein CL840_14535 [Crocinitomicaceae bacterium]|nr:hypothetical protein [Crocinitomicaceae bacterium]|tara:strand:- start:5430 stop:6998 length:1569 start_codon:yes stop_codon:yes gene_type:complete
MYQVLFGLLIVGKEQFEFNLFVIISVHVQIPYQPISQKNHMKRFLLSLAVYFFSNGLTAQSGEFKLYPNGLMYSTSTMNQLEYIVDSLNLKFKNCDLSRTYLSCKQLKGHFVYLEKGNINQALKDMKKNISFDEFKRKYGRAEINKDVLVLRDVYKNWEGEQVIDYSSMVFRRTVQPKKSVDELFGKGEGNWVYEFSSKTEYSGEYVSAFYLSSKLESNPIPEKYARLIQYSDCLVDTSTTIFIEGAEDADQFYTSSQVADFVNYVHDRTNRPVYDTSDRKSYWSKYALWDSTKYLTLDSMKNEEKFKNMLNKATNEALAKGGSNDEFESYVSRYNSPAAALELKRKRQVWGQCSMDNRPRIHALNIAVLSAETINWEVFLRAHLDIMNDNFRRASDGSYAWKRRNTYIRELEELDINVADLLLGISLRLENPSANHYYANIRRVGRALAEYSDKEEIETRMISIIEDESLDDYNRLIIYYLYDNYYYNLQEEDQTKEGEKKLADALNTLPKYLLQDMKKEH